MRAIKVIVQGKVHGVGYRNYIDNKATKLHLVGYVKNLKNGDVEIWVEGIESELLHLIEAARKGSLFSRVSHVDVIWSDPTYNFKVFSIAD